MSAEQLPKALTGMETPDFAVQVAEGSYDPNRDEADIVGERIQVGTTYYDYQANGTVSKQIVLDDDGNVHIVWMRSDDQNNPVVGDREVFYNYVIDDEPQFEDGVAVNGDLPRAGYVNMGYSEETGPIAIYHANQNNAIRLFLSSDADLGEGEFSQFMMPNDDNNNFVVWPHGTIDRSGRSHTLARWYAADGNQGNNPVDLQYNQGTMDEEEEEWEFEDPVIVGITKVLGYTAAASNVSDHVALIYFSPAYGQNEWGDWPGLAGVAAANNDIIVIESEDGEEFDFDDQWNITQVLRPDDDMDDDDPFYVGDTLRPYLYIDACYDDDENLHVVFSTPMLAEAIGNQQRRYDEQHNLLWHWDRDSEQFSLIASGRYNVQGNIGAWRANLSYPSIGVAEDGTLYCIFTRYPENDRGPQNENGQRYVNGEIYCSASADGGSTWSQAINLTETPSPDEDAGDCLCEAWCSLAEVVDDFLHISYILDLDPGGIPQVEGSATENPVMYHRVSRDDIPLEPHVFGMDFHVGYPPEIAVDVDLPQVVAVPEGDPGEVEFTIENSNDDEGATGLHVRLTASEELEDNLSFDFSSRRVAPGQRESFTIFFAPDEQGVYEGVIFLEHNDPEVESPIELNFTGLGAEGYGSISGVVTDLESGDAIEGAVVTLPPGDYEAISNENGEYQFDEVPAWDYMLSCDAENFLPFAEAIHLEPDDEMEFDIEMRYGTFELSVQDAEFVINGDERFIARFNAENEGDGPVPFSTDITVFPDDEDREALELMEIMPVHEIIEDRNLQGVVFADDHFFISGGNNGREPNQIYVVDSEGEVVRSFEQFGDSRLGMRDLAYDGELIWGSDERTVYGFTTDGDLVTELEGPYNPNHGFAWDEDNNLLWVAGRNQDLVAMDLEGNFVQEIERPEDRPGVYALAYYPDDPDGYPLYLFSRLDDWSLRLTKCDPETGDYIEVINFEEPEGGRASGLQITRDYDSHNWTMIGMSDGGADDEVAIWHLDQRDDWLELDPSQGIVSEDEPLWFNLSLDTHHFPEDDELTANIRFDHFGRGDAVELPVAVTVSFEGGITQRVLSFDFGWNMVSLNLIPDDDDIRTMTRRLVENGTLMLVKDDQGRFYAPDFDDFINIPGWDFSEGYMFRMSADDQIEVLGEGLAADRMIELDAGWQMISYYPRIPIDARVALAGIEDNLVIVKNGRGRFYIPEFNFSNIGDMREGEGYQLNAREDGELIYQLEEVEPDFVSLPPELQHFQTVVPTEKSLSLLLLGVPETVLEISADYNGEPVGSGARSMDGKLGLAVWDSDRMTEGVSFNLTGWNGTEEIELDIDWIKGEPRYSDDGIVIGRLRDGSAVPDRFALHQAYPNPFNSSAVIRYDLPEPGDVKLTLYDSAGRSVATLVNKPHPAGSFTTVIDGGSFASGIYCYKFETGSFIQIRKAVLLK